MDQNQPAPLGSLQRLCAIVVGKDVEILARCPQGERHDAVLDAFSLVLLGMLEFGLWSFAMLGFGAGPAIAYPVAGLVALIIATLDVRLTSADNEPRGIFRRGRRAKSYWASVGVRLGICFLLALAPAVATDLAIFREEANAKMEEDRSVRNAPLIQEYDKKIHTLEVGRTGPLDAEIRQLTRQRNETLTAGARAAVTVENAMAEQRTAQLERSRQINGLGDRDSGRGELALDAEARAALAADQATDARKLAAAHANDINALARRITELESRRSKLLNDLEPERKRLIAERDARLALRTDGVLTTFMGLVRLHEDPDRGTGMLLITLGLWSITMALELSFFLRNLFKPASVYDALLTIERQRRVALATHEFAETLAGARRRVPLRIVAARN